MRDLKSSDNGKKFTDIIDETRTSGKVKHKECNDFFPGHILVNPGIDSKISIEGKMGEVLLAKYIKRTDTWAQVYTSQELYDKGWRIEAEPEELPSVEMSVAEVATKLGLDPKTLKIVDK